MHHPNNNNHNNNEWYWNLNLHRDRLSLANTAAIDGTILPSTSAFYTSAVLTDVGICVGMRNVNLNCENQHGFNPRKIPNCFNNNVNVVGEQNKQTWDHACNQCAFPPFDTVTTTGTGVSVVANIPMYVHHPSAVLSTTSMATANAVAAYNFKMHNDDNSPPFDNRLLSHRENRFFSSNNLRISYPTMVEDPSPLQTLRENFHPYIVNRSIKCDLSESKMNAIAVDTGVVTAAATPIIPSAPELLKVLSPLSRYESLRRCHVATPKKKWIRNYMLSKFTILLSFLYSSFIR